MFTQFPRADRRKHTCRYESAADAIERPCIHIRSVSRFHPSRRASPPGCLYGVPCPFPRLGPAAPSPVATLFWVLASMPSKVCSPEAVSQRCARLLRSGRENGFGVDYRFWLYGYFRIVCAFSQHFEKNVESSRLA